MANFPQGVVSQPDRTRSGSCRDLRVLTGWQPIELWLEDNSPITEGSLRNWADRIAGRAGGRLLGSLACRRLASSRAMTSRPTPARYLANGRRGSLPIALACIGGA